MAAPARQGTLILPGDSPPSFTYLAASASFGAALTSDSQLLFFDAPTATILASVHAHDAGVTGLDLNERSRLVSTCCDSGPGAAGNEVSLWDIRSPNSVPVCTFAAACYVASSKRCHCVASNCAGTVIGAGTKQGILIWDIRRPDGLFTHVDIQSDEIASLQFHPRAGATFVAGDDNGNLLVYDLDGGSEEDRVLLYRNDENPVFQCGFASAGSVFALSRTAALGVWRLVDSETEALFEDVRGPTGEEFGYPIDAHGQTGAVIVALGGSEGGVAFVKCSAGGLEPVIVLHEGNRDCVNATFLNIGEDGGIAYLAGDAGELSFWSW
jgi:WD40 repeat protein